MNTNDSERKRNESNVIMTYKGKPISEKEALKLIEKNWKSMQYIKNPTYRVQMEAVEQSSYAISLIDDPYRDVQLKAIRMYAIR